MRGEDREGWAISTTCAILYRFIPVIKVRYWEREEEEEEKEERKGEEKRAQIREKKRKKKSERSAKSEE